VEDTIAVTGVSTCKFNRQWVYRLWNLLWQ